MFLFVMIAATSPWLGYAQRVFTTPSDKAHFVQVAKEKGGFDFPTEEWTQELIIAYRAAMPTRSYGFSKAQKMLIQEINNRFQGEEKKAKLKELLIRFTKLQDDARIAQSGSQLLPFDDAQDEVKAIATLLYQDTLSDLRNQLLIKNECPEIRYLTEKSLAYLQQHFENEDLTSLQNTFAFINDSSSNGLQTYLTKVQEARSLPIIEAENFKIIFQGMSETIVVRIDKSDDSVRLSSDPQDVEQTFRDIAAKAPSASCVLQDVFNIYRNFRAPNEPLFESLIWMHKIIYYLLSVDWNQRDENPKWNAFKNNKAQMQMLLERLKSDYAEEFWEITQLAKVDRASSPTFVKNSSATDVIEEASAGNSTAGGGAAATATP